MDEERVSRCREAMREAGIGLLVCRLPENMTLLAGYYPLTGMNFLALPSEGEPSLLVPESEEKEASAGWWEQVRTFSFGRVDSPDPSVAVEQFLTDVRERRIAEGAAVGFEGSFESVAPALLAGESSLPALPYFDLLKKVFGASVRDATDFIMAQRATKTRVELEKMRVASRVAACGLSAFRHAVEPGRTEAEIAGIVAAAVMRDGVRVTGAERILPFPQVSSGPEHTSVAWRPCVISSDRTIREGDLVVLELGVVVNGFWADNTRTFTAGQETPRQKEIREVVETAQREACAALAPGVRCSDVDRAARCVIEEAGLGEYFIHVTGHGIGTRYHEPVPILSPGNDAALETGMVCSVEPGVYIPGFGGFRKEDILAVAEEGSENLTACGQGAGASDDDESCSA